MNHFVWCLEVQLGVGRIFGRVEVILPFGSISALVCLVLRGLFPSHCRIGDSPACWETASLHRSI